MRDKINVKLGRNKRPKLSRANPTSKRIMISANTMDIYFENWLPTYEMKICCADCSHKYSECSENTMSINRMSITSLHFVSLLRLLESTRSQILIWWHYTFDVTVKIFILYVSALAQRLAELFRRDYSICRSTETQRSCKAVVDYSIC